MTLPPGQYDIGRLPESGYEPADAPVFECYLNSPQQVPPSELLIDICLPLASPP